MGKKKGVPAAEVAGSSSDRVINNLKILHNHLLKEVEEHHKQLQDLQFQLASLAAGRDIAHTIERDIVCLVISSSLDEAAARSNAEMAVATEKAESAAAELNAAETRLRALVREKDAVQRDLEGILEETDSRLQFIEEAQREKTRKKKWRYSMAAAGILLASTVIVTWYCLKASSKHKS